MATIQDQVTATELARNLTTLIDYVRTSGKRLVITRRNIERALLEHNPWSSAERAVLVDNLRTIRKQACLSPSP